VYFGGHRRSQADDQMVKQRLKMDYDEMNTTMIRSQSLDRNQKFLTQNLVPRNDSLMYYKMNAKRSMKDK